MSHNCVTPKSTGDAAALPWSMVTTDSDCAWPWESDCDCDLPWTVGLFDFFSFPVRSRAPRQVNITLERGLQFSKRPEGEKKTMNERVSRYGVLPVSPLGRSPATDCQIASLSVSVNRFAFSQNVARYLMSM